MRVSLVLLISVEYFFLCLNFYQAFAHIILNFTFTQKSVSLGLVEVRGPADIGAQFRRWLHPG